MSKSIEQLRKEYEAAKSRHDNLHAKMRAAKQRLDEAEIAEALAEYASQGITPGCKVRAFRLADYFSLGNGEMNIGIFGFSGVEKRWGGTRPILINVKRDGSIGKQRASHDPSRLELVEAAQ